MRRNLRTVVAASAILLLAACESGREGEQLGSVLGAIGGAVLGSQVGSGIGRVAATAAGGLIGSWVGGAIGRQLDEVDRREMARATREGLDHAADGEVISWRNPDSGNHGTVTPRAAVRDAERGQCRNYRQTVTVGERTEEATGTACRQPDGSWQIVNR